MQIVDNILEAYNREDYARMARDFSLPYAGVMDPTKIEKLSTEFYKPKFGNCISRHFQDIQYKDPWINVRFGAIFEKTPNVRIILTFKQNDPEFKVEGFYFVQQKEATPKHSSELLEKKIRPIVKNFFDFLKSSDFVKAEQDFSDQMSTRMPPEKLKELYLNEILPARGAFVTYEKLRIEPMGALSNVVYLITHASGKKSQLIMTFQSSDPAVLIHGLQYKPLSEILSKEETEALLARAGAASLHYLDSIKEKDYKKATRDFIDKMFDVFGPDKLQLKVNGIGTADLGEVVSWEFDRAGRLDETEALYYTVRFSKGETLTCKIVFAKEGDEPKIMGLWFKPLGED